MRYGYYTREFYDDYIVLDLETTGGSPFHSEILEVAMIKVRQGKPVEKMEVLVRPHKLPVPAFIEELTGITTEMVLDAPYFHEVAPYILPFIEGLPVVGWNVNFDLKFLAVHLRQDLDIDYTDALIFCRQLFPDLPCHKLTFVSRHFGVRESSHRALQDCIATMDLYEAMKRACRKHGRCASDLFRTPLNPPRQPHHIGRK